MSIFLVEAAAGQEFAVWAKGDAVHRLLVSEIEQSITVQHITTYFCWLHIILTSKTGALISNKILYRVVDLDGGRIGIILPDPDPYPFQPNG